MQKKLAEFLGSLVTGKPDYRESIQAAGHAGIQHSIKNFSTVWLVFRVIRGILLWQVWWHRMTRSEPGKSCRKSRCKCKMFQ